MCPTPKKNQSYISVLLKGLLIFLLLTSLKTNAQSSITRIYTDWNNYWTSNTVTPAGNRPDTENNLLGFTWNGTTYSTGVNNSILTSHSVTFNTQKFRALKIQTLGLDTSMYFLQGSKIDGDNATATLVPALAGTTSTGPELASRLTDGTNGLTLGTGIANIKAGTAEFKVGTNNINVNGINDGFPDLIVTQVADPGATGSAVDSFKFIDASGNTVGIPLSASFISVPAVGTYSLDLFRADNGAVAFTPASTRDIRLLGFELNSFGINATNAAQVDRFIVTFSGNSDCAFIAFNTNSLKIAELSLVKKASLSSCGKAGDVITYTFDVKNTGEVPITNITVSDPMNGLTISGNPIASLAPGATQTLTGTYTIKPADVTAGKIVNSAKVTGTDPSLNIVTDISGQTYTDDIATTTILLASPTIGTITNTTCSDLGTVVLNNLPSTGTWTVERNPGAVTKSGTGTSATITGIPVGTYSFKVSVGGCNSPYSTTFSIADNSSTTWNGSAWTSAPDATKNAIITTTSPNQPFTSNATVCSCTINSNVIVTIPNNVTLTVKDNITVKAGGKLLIQNGGALLQNNNSQTTFSGNIADSFELQRTTLPVRRYDLTYWSSPVTAASGFTLKKLSPATLDDKYYSYNSVTDKWVNEYRGEATMIPGRGYNVRAPQTYDITGPGVPYTASFVGIPTNGDVSLAVVGGNWSLGGNPYPSALNASKFITDNGTNVGTIYFWTHATNPSTAYPGVEKYNYNSDDFASFNLTGLAQPAPSTPSGVVPSGYIAAGQGFFFRPSVTGTVKFTNSMRESGNNTQFYKTANTTEVEKNRVWLNLTNDSGAFKQLLVGYIAGATNSYDINYDSETTASNSFIDFYSINDSRKLTIQGRAVPFDDTEVLPLGYKSTVAGDFTIAIDHADGLFSDQPVYLEDKKTGNIQNLANGNYTFTTAIGTFTERFVLHYTSKNLGTGDFENLENTVLVAVKNKAIKVTTSKESIKEVTIFDITGKQLYNKTNVGAAELQISNLQSSNQMLLVKVTLENDFTTTKKIIFK